MAEARTVAGGKRADECRDLRLMLWRCVQVAGCCMLMAFTVPLLLTLPMAVIRSYREGHAWRNIAGLGLFCVVVAAVWKTMQALNIVNAVADEESGCQELARTECTSESASYRPPACRALQT
mmetsp:Transcript_24627/g.56845  ORF Transcript_24627/g.56845 Transcript_24627/m.56845 type:complete len:122 (+) Transcript_24627:38-403(+)